MDELREKLDSVDDREATRFAQLQAERDVAIAAEAANAEIVNELKTRIETMEEERKGGGAREEELRVVS